MPESSCPIDDLREKSSPPALPLKCAFLVSNNVNAIAYHRGHCLDEKEQNACKEVETQGTAGALLQKERH